MATSAFVTDRAAHAVKRAIEGGEMQPGIACEVCGLPAGKKPTPRGRMKSVLVAHHWSYAPENWLSVVWLCHRDHRRVHAGRIPEPRTGRVYETHYRQPNKGPQAA